MLPVKIFIVFMSLWFIEETTSYSCSHKQIIGYGRAAPLTRPFFTSMLAAYRNYRLPDVDTKMLVPFLQTNETGTILLFDGTRSGRSKQDYETMFPIFGQAIVVIYNLPGTTNLNLSIQNIADIYSGKIQYWNDTRLRIHNQNVTLPYERIRPVARAETDLTTAMFTDVLSTKVSEWSRKYGSFYSPQFDVNGNATTWQWDVISIYATQIVGMVGVVTSFKYTIGYATMDTVSQYTVSQANILVSDDVNSQIIAPTVENIQEAMINYVNKSFSNDLEIKLSYALTGDAYPFSVSIYMFLNWTYNQNVDCCAVREVIGFVHWIMFEVDDDVVKNLGYAPLIDEIRQLVKSRVLSRIQCSEGLVYDSFLETIAKSNDWETWKIVLSVISVITLLISSAVGFFFLYRKKYYIDESRWMIHNSRVKIADQSKSNEHRKDIDGLSIKSTGFSLSNDSHDVGVNRHLKSFMVTAEVDGNKVYLHKLQCKPSQQWSRETKRAMMKMKNLLHKNLTTLIGISIMKTNCFVLLEYAQKGSLHYFLRTCRYELSETIVCQFAINVAQGLKYLHQHGIVHGFLSSLTCYLDASWTVKIACWEALSVYKIENFSYVLQKSMFNPMSEFDEAKLIQLLYIDPHIGTNIGEHIDVYSFGFLLMEIFSRKIPYATEVDDGRESYVDLLHKKINQNKFVRPVQPKAMPTEFYHLAMICLAAEEKRPKTTLICEQLSLNLKNDKGIVDIVMETLESYADDLENKVTDRTVELKQVTEKMRHLLHEVLPQQIADKLLLGEPIQPEQFECVTIYFSDIVGFTNISANSSPNEVMSLLNDLWLAFDAVIDKFDVYKVDTIGDAYMVCSGLPLRNGMEHCRQIALLALALLDKCNRFKIKHLPMEQLKIRIGINSGSVTAGVVGSKMPQYCVFGDAVNTAARMESTSLAQKIQLSERSFMLLNDYYPNMFEMTYRGEIDVKGKGTMNTYWLSKHL